MSGATRRGFMAFLPGAMLGGKKALADTAEKLALGESGAAGLSAGQFVGGVPQVVADNKGWAVKSLARLRHPDNLADKWNNTGVGRIDPDLAVQHSRSLSAKILAQKRRNYERELANEKTYFERVISGFFD